MFLSAVHAAEEGCARDLTAKLKIELNLYLHIRFQK